MSDGYPLAKHGVFATVQGEGALLGLPMVFVRLAGCSIGCKQCDTDYGVFERLSAKEIAWRVASALRPGTRWVWITGGEPTDHDLTPLYAELRRIPDALIALATAGTRAVVWPCRADGLQPDWLSVSPHDMTRWVQRRGDELKLVFGLRGLSPEEAGSELEKGFWFGHHYVQPLSGDRESVAACRHWVEARPHSPEWRLTVQAHKLWEVP